MKDEIKQYGEHLYTRPGDSDFLPEVLFYDPANGESSTPILPKQAIYLEAASSLLDSPTPDPSFWTDTAIRTAKEAALETVRKILWTPGIIAIAEKKRADAPKVYYSVLQNVKKVLTDWKPEIEAALRQNYPEFFTETAETE